MYAHGRRQGADAVSEERAQPLRRAWADIDLTALQHNFSIARATGPESALLAVIKANAYGHGVRPVAAALAAVMADGDAFAVASLREAITLRQYQPDRPVLVMQGVHTAAELSLARDHRLWLVVHAPHQLALLQDGVRPEDDWVIWLKLETGMHRLGLDQAQFAEAWRSLDTMPGVSRLVLMSHLACADDLQSDSVPRQLSRFDTLVGSLQAGMTRPFDISLAASGGLLAWPAARRGWLRPGIMLYGGSPMIGEIGPQRNLRPVMTLRSRLIAIKTVPDGESVGYGATYTADGERRIGVVSIGYGDGYPRHAPNGTPVAVIIDGVPHRTRLAGRVSMDMLTIELDGLEAARVGDEVMLWGDGVPADEVARHCGTISYELFCQVTSRVELAYNGGQED